MIGIDEIRRAAQRLAGAAHRTPVLTSRSLNDRVGAEVFAKAENQQRAGAFKFRGAYNSVAALSEAERSRGVVTYSSGNHGQALALAARLHGVPAAVVMPSDAPAVKRDAVAGYGATIEEYDRYAVDRTKVAEDLAADLGAALIPPFDHWDVIAGQGTAALELVEQTPDLDVLVVCVGGGGLIAGCALAAKTLMPQVRVIGVEPDAGDDVKRSLESGQIVEIPVPTTIADGQQTTAPGEKTFEVISRFVDEIVTVTDPEIVDAMRFAFERMKTVLEPSGASALAALLAGFEVPSGARVGVTFSGGNVDVDRFAALLGPGV